ncbi:hypothetical protein [Anaeromassilibacillus senegalensis]|uniref:hypothetical protein n=1 Tax=Anaeromassilibacillus senegalensis TaxID=1673717 RepID=UPI000681314C|nr:hypothetical protein [Anaeromassilibacillus senegalensis]
MLKHLLHTSDKSLRMSAPPTRELYGVKIRKLPVGKYLQVLRAIDDLPATLFSAIAPGAGSPLEGLLALERLDKDGVAELTLRLLTVVPEQFCRAVADLLDIPAARLLDPDAPDALGLMELAEIIEAAWQANDMTDFFGIVRRLVKPTDKQANTGSSAG